MVEGVALNKQALRFRAKYRYGQTDKPYMMKLHPMLLVPHPENLSGEPVKSLRTRELSGTIANDGADAEEANLSAVAVMDYDALPQLEASPRKRTCRRSFQEQFEKQVERDVDMAISSQGFPRASFGSLSHSHFNCASRNAMCGKKGCECPPATSFCTCANKAITDRGGGYDMQKIKGHDRVWHDLIEGGLTWEILDRRMDLEEPGAAKIISVALNRRTSVAMRTSELELWSALRSLCKPDPVTGVLAFEPVRKNLIDLFGVAVDQCGLSSAFQLIMDLGGGDSAYLEHLQEFTDLFVNPKKRRLKWEAYDAVAGIPIEFPSFKVATIMYVYRQPPQKGWCPLPPPLAYRFVPGGPLALCRLLEDMEVVMSYVRTCTTAVAVERVANTTDEQKSRKASITRLGAEMVIAMVKLIVEHPKQKKVDGKDVHEQQALLSETCAGLVADTFRELLKLSPKFDFPEGAENSRTLNRSFELLQSGASQVTANAETAVAVPQPQALMVPTVALVDANGRLRARTTDIATQSPPEPSVTIIPWKQWYSATQEDRLVARARSTLHAAMGSLIDRFYCPVSFIRKSGHHYIVSKATADIELGGLVIPIHSSAENIVSALKPGLVTHPRAVHCKVHGSVVTDGNEDAREFGLVVNPEVKIESNKNPTLSSLQMHPFWLVQRQAREEEEPNCILENQYVTSINGCTWRSTCLKEACQRDGTTCSWAALVPVITNDKFIKAGDSVILKHTIVKPQEKPKRRERTWHDDFRKVQKKLRKWTDGN